MSKKISIRGHSTQTYAEVFQFFISAKTAQGVADITIRNYHNNLHVISKYLDTSRPLGEITKWDIDEMIVSMRRAGLAHNSISTYVRIVRTFLNWCSVEGLKSLSIPNMKDKDTVKETYRSLLMCLL